MNEEILAWNRVPLFDTLTASDRPRVLDSAEGEGSIGIYEPTEGPS